MMPTDPIRLAQERAAQGAGGRLTHSHRDV
jgi:hypothetical protein